MVDWEENTLTFESKQLHYYFSRSGTGRTIIFLHGIMDNGMCYDRVAEQFAENYDLYLPDARGHGQSSEMPDKGDFSLLIEDIKDISEQNNLSNVIVMGHSMGGAEAAQFAADEPQLVKAVILEDPAFFSGFSKKLLHALAGILLLFFRHQEHPKPLSEFEKRSKKLNSKWDLRDQLVWAKAQREFAIHYPKKSLTILKTMPEGPDVIPKIQVPILLITSEKGLVKKKIVEQLQAVQPRLQWKYIQGAGHNIRREQFQVEVDAVKAFIDSLEW